VSHINPAKLADRMRDFVAHATKYATGTTAFGGITKADTDAALADLEDKREAKVAVDTMGKEAASEAVVMVA